MTARAQPVSRRWFIGAGAAIAGSGLPPGATAQPAADGFRLLRARALPSTGLGHTGLGYDGIAPGPTLRVRRGDDLRVRLVNDLAAPTSVHWHGIRLPNAMDGVPQLTQPAVAPGASFDYRFRPPDAGTFWYHAYIVGQTDRALDGQPAEPFLARDSRVGLGPGNRIDLFVDTTGDAGAMVPLLAAPLTDAKAERPIARLVYERGGAARVGRRSEPLPLPPNPLPAHNDLRNSLKAELLLANAKTLDP